MKRLKIIVIVVCATILLLGSVIATDPNKTASAETNPAVQVENNKMLRNELSFEITKVNFNISKSTNTKFAEVYMTIENTNGRDKAMLPKGSIVAMVGSSGKVYNIVTKDEEKGTDNSYDVLYKETESYRKSLAEKKNKTYEPGVFLVAPGVSVDMSEENIAAVVYEDVNGKRTNIPIAGIAPTTTELTGGK